MRKFFALLCVAAATVCFGGCAKSEPAPSAPAATEQPADQEEVVVEETVEEKSP